MWFEDERANRSVICEFCLYLGAGMMSDCPCASPLLEDQARRSDETAAKLHDRFTFEIPAPSNILMLKLILARVKEVYEFGKPKALLSCIHWPSA